MSFSRRSELVLITLSTTISTTFIFSALFNLSSVFYIHQSLGLTFTTDSHPNMVRLTTLAALVLVPLAQARFDWLYERDTIAQCPPCSVEREPQDCSHTVTVTKPSGPYETVTVSDPKDSYHTVTVTEHGGPGKTVTITQNYQSPETKVVYVSQGETISPSKETVTVTSPGKAVTVTETETSEHVVTKKVDVYSGPRTVTISHGYPAPSAGSPGYDGGVVTKIVGGGGGSDNQKYPDNAYTVTVIKDGEYKTLTYTDGNYNTVVKTITQDNGHDKVETVTGKDEYEAIKIVTLENSKKIAKTITADNTNTRVVTKTIQQGGKYQTVIVKPKPTVSTITKDNGDCITTVVEVPQTYTLTAPAKYGSAAVTDDDCETFTRTAIYTGKPEVEIIVHDPETGDSTCTKKDGQPCNPGYDNGKADYGNDGTHTGGTGSKSQDYDPSYTKGQDGSDIPNTDLPVYTKIRTYGNGDVYTEVHGAEPTECDSAAVSTSIATVFNTVVVTVDASPSRISATKSRSANKARSPLSVRW
ncbi:hypothetical protein F53441_11058 [Fusarium austroafricanum]|uniref:Uncharacterized protein n=1 Tax=Fusarium austroafricanum TaxID=2364996 RepID=A0A8H4K6V6_9HYPO|nr:hypothetical protein F53441_11058 [Fusarium austroafricanum]